MKQFHNRPVLWGSKESGLEITTNTEIAAPTRRVALWITADEADALMAVLLHCPDAPHIAGATTERLMCRVAGVHRNLKRRALRRKTGDRASRRMVVRR